MVNIDAAINAARAAIEATYINKCNIVEFQSYKKANKSTGQREVTILENQPCKLSVSSTKSNVETDSAEMLLQSVKLFISPDIDIKPGSKIIVTHCGRTTSYKNSGLPAVYDTHQEIMLEPFKGWA